MKELSHRNLIYIIGGAVLLVTVALALYLGAAKPTQVVIDPSKYDLTDSYNQQQFDQLVEAHAKLTKGFDFSAAIAQATALVSLEDYSQAEIAWKYFIANRPSALQGYWGLGDLYNFQGKFVQSEENWLKAIAVDKSASYANPYIKLADLYRDHFPEKRYQLVQILTDAMVKNPTEANYPLLLATYYRDIGDKASAIRFYEETIALTSDKAAIERFRAEINALKS